MSADPWKQRVDAGDWTAITAEVNEYGGALLPELLTAGETKQIRDLYEDDGCFRATINMGRHRFGEGEYRYFKAPYPEPVERLKQALYPRLLPIARDWHAKLCRPAPWPDTLDEWLRMCHDVGQDKPTAILLFYVGVLFAYFFVFPVMFSFFASTTPKGVSMMTDINSYLDFVLVMFFAFGAAFEVPVAVVLLVITGIVKLEKLRENGWNISKTAEVIGTPRSNLYKKLEQYQITQEQDG